MQGSDASAAVSNGHADPSSSVGAHDSVADTVEAALDTEDLGPLVRVVFGAPIAASQAQHGRSASTDSGADDEDDGQPRDVAAEVLQALEAIVQEQSSQISNTCRVNADEIGNSILELGSMQSWARGLKKRLLPANRGMQSAGVTYHKKLLELQELTHIQEALAAAHQAIVDGQRLLLLLMMACQTLQNGHLHRTHVMLQQLRTEQFDEWMAAGQKANYGVLSGLGTLQPYLMATADDLASALQQRAVADFNDWLVKVRSEARNVGLRAVRKAAAERAREALLASERHVVQVAISSKQPKLASAVGCIANESAMATAPTATRATARESNIDVLEGISMTPLHRCIHVHQCLGRMDDFLEYYQSNRRLQLNSDLTPPPNFIESYQKFIAQVVGFFIVEDRVQRAADMAVGLQLGAGWEAAVACLKATLESAFESMTSAESLIAVKDFVLLVCTALGACGYHVVPLHEILLSGRLKHQEMLSQKLHTALDQLLKGGSLGPLRITQPEVAAELVQVLALPLSWDGIAVGPDQLPISAPFSPSIPELVRLLRRHVSESVAYSSGLSSAAEAVPTARQQRDGFVKRVVVDCLQSQLASATSHADALQRTAQVTADTACLIVAAPYLDDFTVKCARGHPETLDADEDSERAEWLPPARVDAGISGTGSGPAAGAAALIASLQAVQETGERFLVSIVASEVASTVAQAKVQDWEPEAPSRQSSATLSAWTEQLLAGFKEVFAMLLSMLPPDSAEHVLRAVLSFTSSTILGLFAEEDGVQTYNMFALFRLHADVSGLVRFADTFTSMPGLQAEMAEALQFCELFVLGRPEDVAKPGVRERMFPALDKKRLIAALKRYRDVHPHFQSGHGLPGLQAVVKRSTIDATIKKLQAEKDQTPS